MVKAADVNKDIEAIARKVGIAVFSYDELHNKNVKNNFHYDYQKVIDEVSRIHGKDMTDELVKSGTLFPLPGGEYRIEVGKSTKEGGGLNVGTAFFSFSSSDLHTKYHELAHSLQRQYNLFNDETIDKMYTVEKNKLGGADKADGKLASVDDYNHYLKEMHSESFAFAALMLRAKNPLDFAYQTVKTYSSGVVRNIGSLTAWRKPVYNGKYDSKYYTSYSVMKETIKQMWKIRKAKKQGEFFDANGVLSDEKLARLMERVVIKSAYTPRSLHTLFKNKWGYKSGLHENGWRRDMVKSVLAAPLIFIADNVPVKGIVEHAILRYGEKKKLKQFMSYKYQGKDRELAALDLYSKLRFMSNDKFSDKAPYLANFEQAIIQNGGCSKQTVGYLATRAAGFVDDEKSVSKLNFYFTELNNFVMENKDNPYFVAICQSGMSLAEAFKLRDKKLKNGSESVLDLQSLQKDKSNGYAYYPIVLQVKNVVDFAQKYDKSGEFGLRLTDMIIRNPELLQSEEARKKIAMDFMPAKKRKAFMKEFDDVLGGATFSYLLNNMNPKYIEALDKLRKLPNNEILATAQQEFDLEKAGKRHKKEKEEVQAQNGAQASQDKNMAADNSALVVEKSPKEQVAEKLKSWGIDEGSYLILAPEDNVYTTYGVDEVRSAQSYFDEGAKKIKETGKDVVYGTNNGMVGAYFAEGVYVVSNNFQFRSRLYHKGEDSGFGVMLSNGEQFAHADGSKNDLLNYKWKNAKQKGGQITELIHQQYMERQKNKEMSQTKLQQNKTQEVISISNAASRR